MSLCHRETGNLQPPTKGDIFKSVLNTNKSVLNTNKSVLNTKKSVLNTNKSVLNTTKSVLNTNKSVLNTNKANEILLSNDNRQFSTLRQ